MENEIQPQTSAGAEMVAAAERFAAAFAADIDRYDREGSFPFDHAWALRDSGFAYAPLPIEAGGRGVESIHDIMVATSRLARGDASVTLGINMHLIAMITFGRQWRLAKNRGDDARAAGVVQVAGGLAAEGALMAAAVSEPDQDLLRPSTVAERAEDGHWYVSGRKIFSSMAPVATHFSTSVLYVDDAGSERYAYAIVPRTARGVTVNDDWDALGMRASGSTSVTFDRAKLPRSPGRGIAAGVITAEHLEQWLPSGPAHTSASLGVAEAAYGTSIEAVTRKHSKPGARPMRAQVQQLAAENSIDLAAARAIFSRSLSMMDAYHAAHPTERGTLEEITPVFAEVQRAKQFVNATAVRIVDRALAMSGGAGFMAGNPLSRHYRDARAGAFMHPLGANVAGEYLGAVALGLDPQSF